MDVVAWIIVGLIAGWLASQLLGPGRYGLLIDMVVGVLSAVIGGWLAAWLMGIDVIELDFASVAAAVFFAISVMVIFRAVAPGETSAV
ncbi:MAG: GlsB/YeaQ/YmgE family stress response membrane protein [Chloroflexota bacterium]|nr:MAG: GlsB/YeaQ/YmgE family stress response membrane protein [Chloroflexota bacterium]